MAAIKNAHNPRIGCEHERKVNFPLQYRNFYLNGGIFSEDT